MKEFTYGSWTMNKKTGIINHFCGGIVGMNKHNGRELKSWEKQDDMQYGFQPTEEYDDPDMKITGQRCILCNEVCTDVEDIVLLGE